MAIRTTPRYSDDYSPSLEEQIGEFPTITTQGRDIALQDAREDAQDNAEYLDWWLRQGIPTYDFPQFPVGPRPVIFNENEGAEVSGVGQSPVPVSPTVATQPNRESDPRARPVEPPKPPRFVISQAPIQQVQEQDFISIRPEESGYNVGVMPVDVSPPIAPPIAPPTIVLCCPLD